MGNQKTSHDHQSGGFHNPDGPHLNPWAQVGAAQRQTIENAFAHTRTPAPAASAAGSSSTIGDYAKSFAVLGAIGLALYGMSTIGTWQAALLYAGAGALAGAAAGAALHVAIKVIAFVLRIAVLVAGAALVIWALASLL